MADCDESVNEYLKVLVESIGAIELFSNVSNDSQKINYLVDRVSDFCDTLKQVHGDLFINNSQVPPTFTIFIRKVELLRVRTLIDNANVDVDQLWNKLDISARSAWDIFYKPLVAEFQQKIAGLSAIRENNHIDGENLRIKILQDMRLPLSRLVPCLIYLPIFPLEATCIDIIVEEIMLQRVNVHAYIHSQSKDNDDLFRIADAQLKAIDETLLKSCIGIICCAYSGFWNTINQSMEQLMTIITQWKIHLVQRDAVGLVESESIANLDVEADHVSKKQKKSDLLRDEHKGSLDSNGGYLARMEWLMNELSVHVGYCILLKKSLKVEFEGNVTLFGSL